MIYGAEGIFENVPLLTAEASRRHRHRVEEEDDYFHAGARRLLKAAAYFRAEAFIEVIFPAPRAKRY